MKLGGALVEQTIKKKAFVFKQGDRANGFYIIKSGEVREYCCVCMNCP
jgi:CRP-like cAMP-binding protein